MDTTKLRRAASWLTFTGVNAALLEVADLLDRLPAPSTCPQCEANAALHRRCPEHQPEEESAPDEEASLCMFCGKDTWDGSRMICTDPECGLFQPEEDTAGKDHLHCPQHGEPQPCNVCAREDAEAEVERLTATVAALNREIDALETQIAESEGLDQGEGESKGEGGRTTAAEGPGSAGPAETGARTAEAPSPKLGLRQNVGELLAGALPGLSGVPEVNAREVCRLIDAHLAEDAAREKRHAELRVAAVAALAVQCPETAQALRAALKEDSSG